MIKKNKSRRKLKYVLKHLRHDDKVEMIEIYGQNWFPKVLKSMMKADFKIGISNNGKPFAVFGCSAVENLNDCGIVYLLSTAEIENKKFTIIKNAKKELMEYERKYKLLFNFIHRRNFKMINLLKYLGFNFLHYNLNDNPNTQFFYKRYYLKGLG